MAATAQAGVSVPIFQLDEQRHRRQISQWSAEVNQGHIKNVGSVTLNASTVSTTVADARVSMQSFVGLMPMTANALSAMPTCWVSTLNTGAFTITHASSAAADKTFRYSLLG